MTDAFIKTLNKRIDESQKFYYSILICGRWLSIRFELLGNLVILCTALMAIFERGSLSPGQVGLSISYAMTITSTLYLLVKGITYLESYIVAVERILEYTRIEQEAEWYTQYGRQEIVANSWPHTGDITFHNYSTRYRAGMDLVLKQLNIVIPSGKRVGIVGRTGW